MNGLTLQQVLNRLSADGLAEPGERERIADLLTGDGGQERPWFIQVLIGAGAWLAAIMFLTFFIGTVPFSLRRMGTVFIVQGLLLSAGAAAVFRLVPRGIFSSQFALAAGLAGQVLFAFGVGEWTNEVVAGAIALTVLEVILAFVSHYRVQTFLSVLISAVALIIAVWNLKAYQFYNVLAIIPALGLWVLWDLTTLHARRQARTAGYGLAAALFTVLLLSLAMDIPGMGQDRIHWWPSTAGLATILLALEYRITRSLDVPSGARAIVLLFCGTAILSAVCWRSPGILAALLVLGIGHCRQDRLLSGMALCFLPVFLLFFYYHLELTLLEKSAVLTGSGVLLLLFRAISTGRRPELPSDTDQEISHA